MGASAVEVSTSRVAEVGGLELRRSLPQRARRTIGAWCFADHYGPVTMTDERSMDIGPHPHIGLHTVTWLFAGEMLHTDSLGSEQLIRPGQLNLMTGGHGIAHAEETPTSHRGTTHGMQLWVAQPEATREGSPAFEHHRELPELELGPASVRVLVGAFGEARSPARADTPLLGAEVRLPPGRGSAELPVDAAHEHGIVVAAGAVRVDGELVPTDSIAHLPEGRSSITVSAEAGATFLLLGGRPFGETITMWWNFVARTHEEIRQAADDWNADADGRGPGRFGVPVDSHFARIPAPPVD